MTSNHNKSAQLPNAINNISGSINTKARSKKKKKKNASPSDNLKDNCRVSLICMKSAYHLFVMKSIGCDIQNHKAFILNKDKKRMTADPILAIYNAVLRNSILKDAMTNYKYNVLKTKLETLNETAYDQIKTGARLYGNKKEATAEDMRKLTEKVLIRRIKIIYYMLVFDADFRQDMFEAFDPKHIAKKVINIPQNIEGANVTEAILEYSGTQCIQCNESLTSVFVSGRTNGTIAVCHYRKKDPKLCNVYLKKCDKCNIKYNYNRIDFADGSMYYLDPDAFAYYSISGTRTRHYMHQSIIKSIDEHQYCNRSTSIDIWLKHQNKDWQSEYEAMCNTSNMPPQLNSVELGYSTILRHYYFCKLLCNLRDIIGFGSVSINDRQVKIALKVTKWDRKK